jgi:hypothetical protein
LLTASEIAQLRLNADWVVLSACNTVAGDKPGAEALSGLTRAFFYAGARALLVSHRAVESRAATRLTTATFDLLRADPRLGRAEALRRAMLDYLADTSTPMSAYPALRIGSEEIDLHALQLFCTIVRQRLDAFVFHAPLMLFSEESAKFRVCGEEPGAVSYLGFKASRVFAEYLVEEADIARCPRSDWLTNLR